MIDLASLSTSAACDKGFDLELLHPTTRAPLGVFITVVGKDSATFRDHVRAKANSRLRKQFADQRKNKELEPPTVEKAESDAIELLAACTTGWRTGDKPTVTHGGKPLEFSQANAQFLYRELWIREQVDEAVGDLENFMKG